MSYQPGPKELALKAMRESNPKKNRKPSTPEVRNRVAKIKSTKPNRKGRRGR